MNPKPGDKLELVAKFDRDSPALIREITGIVSHVDEDDGCRHIWMEATEGRQRWEDEPAKLARQIPTSCHRERDLYGVTPAGEETSYQVRCASPDGYCNPVGHLVKINTEVLAR